ncbi:hypothetical protein ACEN2J_18210 [Pseudorhodobacter sp. W20_MBD10_FR17]|uniref:hypothetical protein n=1 Tax=Pseudorhodobacter sp. W20_MBD10_FR17 TaxID=3240266 RepID=UPI003F983FE6
MNTKIERPPLAMRILFATPILGHIARDIQKDINSIYYALVILVTLVVLGVKAWGVVALAMTALAFVPVVLITLIAITLGK